MSPSPPLDNSNQPRRQSSRRRPNVLSPALYDPEFELMTGVEAMEEDEQMQSNIFYSGPPRQPTRSQQRLHGFFLNNGNNQTTNNGSRGDSAPFVLLAPPASNTSDDRRSDETSYQQSVNQATAELNRATMMLNTINQRSGRLGGQLQVGPDGQTYFNTGRSRNTNNSSISNSPLRNKIVYNLHCAYCQTHICGRAMRAILLADTKVELYSTDIPPSRLRLLDDDRMTQGCNCRIRDTACQTCGNVMGYHVSQPCERCLEARNNGHFWMFYSETVVPTERKDPVSSGKPLYWGALGQASDMLDVGGSTKAPSKPYECYCR